MSRRVLRPSLLSVVMILACAEDEGTAGNDPTGGPQTTDAQGGSDSTGPDGDSGAQTTSDESGDTEGPSCEDFVDAPARAPVPVTIRNHTDGELYLRVRSQCGTRAFSIQPPAHTSGSPFHDGCFTCQGVIEGTCACPGAPCQPYALILLEPGGIWADQWVPALFEATELPEPCVSAGCPSQCSVRQVASQGAYRFTATAADEATGCRDTDDDPIPCSCTPGGDGGCAISGPGQLEGTPVSSASVLDWPKADEIELVFE